MTRIIERLRILWWQGWFRFVAGWLAGWPFTWGVAWLRHRLETAAAVEPEPFPLGRTFLWFALFGWTIGLLAWRYGRRRGVQVAMQIVGGLSIPLVIIQLWMAYWALVGGLLDELTK